MDIAEKISELQQRGDTSWAWKNFLPTVKDLVVSTGAKSILEIGGGRSPSFSKEEVENFGLDYTVNDISARELSLAPDWVKKAHFDIQTPNHSELAPFEGQFDLVYSQMVMEHVASFERAYKNIYRILAPGGVSIAFHPVLYAAPFVINRLIPESASEGLLRRVFPHRSDDGVPKFPAVYSGCVISEGFQRTLKDIGFSTVRQVPFYGHNYYMKIPVVRELHDRVSAFIRDRNLRQLASFCYTIAIK